MNRLLLVVFGCAAATVVQAQAPAIRDSAGVRIIENPARATAPVRFALGAPARLDVGGLEDNPDLEFNPRQGYLRGAWLSTGGLAVSDEVRVQLFDARGTRQAIVGRKGRGPEEFSYITSICRTRGDTLVTSDSQNRRLAILTGSGHAVRTFPHDTLGSPPFSGCFDDGTVLMMKTLPRAAGEPVGLRLARVRVDGTIVNALGEWDAGAFDMVTQSAPVLTASGERFYFGDPRTSEVRMYSATGTLLRIVRSADRGTPITNREAEERMRRTIPRNTPAAEVRARLERMQSMARASHWPTFRDVQVSPAGELWVQDYQKEFPSPDGWSRFDTDGRLIGRLVIPAPPEGERPVQVISFGNDEVLVREQDEDGAAHLVVYPIVRARR